MLAVAFPDDQMQILPYNRVVKDLAGRTPDAFLAALRAHVRREPRRRRRPAKKGEVSMYLGGRWYTIRPARRPAGATSVGSTLDVQRCCRSRCWRRCSDIADVRTDKRIDFVGGIRGTGELERLVDSGKAAVAFSMYPGRRRRPDGGSPTPASIMPPKSTWFEPKLRDGLLTHLI